MGDRHNVPQYCCQGYHKVFIVNRLGGKSYLQAELVSQRGSLIQGVDGHKHTCDLFDIVSENMHTHTVKSLKQQITNISSYILNKLRQKTKAAENYWL